MSSLTIALISAACIFGGALLGLFLNHPLRGMIKASSAPMRKALEHLGQ